MHAVPLALPYFHLGSLDIGLPIQSFGVIVAVGVLIGAALLRRYAEWHGVDDEHIRALTGWVTISGFIGAHVFDVLAYQWQDLQRDPVLFFELWKGISSYGGFLGGAAGFAFYVWWKRQPVRLFADITIVGLLPAFSIGRIGCTMVSDHIGAAVDPAKWYAALAMDYPKDFGGPIANLIQANPGVIHGNVVPAWNLGLIEFLYLVPVNLLVLWLAFRPDRRLPTGFVPCVTGILYAPVRFFLDFLRPSDTDPRYAGLTFAQWASILAFGVAIYATMRVLTGGKPAEPVTRTSGEAQRRLKVILKETADAQTGDKKDENKAESKKAKKTTS
jgi:phosphatidylglycerol:prolipoprotein diacylglycerol transferase